VDLPHTPSGYADGLLVVMRPITDCTGASSINVNSLGVKSIKTASSTAPAAGDINAGVPISLRYSSATGFFHIVSNSAASALAAAASAVAAALSAVAAAASASAASGSASAASTAQTNAETAETNAETAETNAETAETGALAAQLAAETAQTAAELAETHAETAETNAETAETNAETAETNAAASALAASGSASAASIAQTAAELAETHAETAETNAETAETNAETAETNAAASALAAAASAAIAADFLNSVFTAADQVIVGTGVNTHGQITLAASQIFGKASAGAAKNLTATEVRTIINVDSGADVTGSNAPQAHSASHENAGGDEISVAGLSGTLADAQTAAAHKTSHQNGGGDEISVAALSGLLADDQHVLDAEVQAISINAVSEDATPDLGGPLSALDEIISRPKFQDYSEVRNNIGDFGGGAQAIDLELGNVVLTTVSTGAVTYTFTNPPASGASGSFTLKQTNGGSQTVNWPGAVNWEDGSAPDLTAAGLDILVFSTEDAGTVWDGMISSKDSK